MSSAISLMCKGKADRVVLPIGFAVVKKIDRQKGYLKWLNG